ncbi:MAG: hypothetical protein EPN61_15355 [Burkholderiaceae bacterium]|nr:MAG: hypothetical protein EPN61_15355 [Burkholderiaceae bacterium]
MTTSSNSGRGGTRAGAGRKRIAPAGEPGVVYKIRMTQAQRAKLEQLGGAAWMRQMIERGNVPVD